jgi:hypothetical protein
MAAKYLISALANFSADHFGDRALTDYDIDLMARYFMVDKSHVVAATDDPDFALSRAILFDTVATDDQIDDFNSQIKGALNVFQSKLDSNYRKSQRRKSAQRIPQTV